MRRKKGFTLIELLAVIVVLAIILVLAVPKILDLIEKADRQAYKESAELMAHTAKIQYNSDEVTGSAKKIPEEGIVYTFEEGVQTVSGGFELLKFKGDKPYQGTITLTKDKKVIISDLISKNKKWCAKKEANEKQARVGKRTDPDFNCKIDGEDEVVIEDEKECELATNDDKTIYYIDSPSDLYAFSQSVNSGNSYEGITVKVRNNIDMSTAKGKCVTNFEPIGTSDNAFKGTFNGGAKIISNLTIDSKNTWVGIFGVTNAATLYGIILENISVTGSNSSVGGLIGLNMGSTSVKEIQINSMKVQGTTYVGGLFGHASTGVNGSSIVVKNLEVYGQRDVYGTSADNGHRINNTIIENLKIEATTANDIYTHYSDYTTYVLNYSITKNKGLESESISEKSSSKEVNDINMYEAAGLDTWIGGDDGSGYYFDYDKKGNIVLKSVEKNPITFNLKGSGTESDPYLIENEKHWKEVSTRPLSTDYYKVVNNLDFSTNKYYMLGSSNTPFQGNFNGDMKQINNITINASSTPIIGVFGKVSKTKISKLNLNNVNISGANNTGGIVGYLVGPSYITTVKINGNVKGTTYVGGLIGYDSSGTSYTDEVEVTNMIVKGSTSVGGIVGSGNYGVKYNSVLVKNVSVYGDKYVNGLSANSSDKPNNTVVENMIVVGTSGTDIYTNWSNDTTYILNYSLTRNKGNASENTFGTSNSKEVNDINMYEAAGLDTWIGGDNDTTGYYFDYDSNNSIVLKSVKDNPFTFTLKGSGTESDPYLIENEKHWKEVSARPLSTDYYKVVNNLDFSTNKYYMLGSANTPFQGNFNGDMKQINNITINASSTPVIGVFGKVSKTKISKLNLNNVNISGANNTGGIVGYLVGPSYITTVKINGNVKGATNVGGTVGTNYSATSYLDEAEIANMVIRGTSSVGGLTGNTSYGVRNSNILVKNMEIYGDKYVYASVSNNNSDVKGAVFENLKIVGTTSTSIYTGYSGETKYIIKYTLTRSVGTESEEILTSDDSSNLGNLPYYANMIETLYTGDTNNTGYFFDYDSSKNGIYLTKAYSLTFTSPPSDDSSDTNTEGGGTDADTCYITISCSGSGSYRNCYINYYENGVSEAPYLNTMTLDLTRGSSCAAYSPSNSPGGFNFYVKKKSSGSCSVTFRARSNADCVTTTYKTISF